MADPEIARMDKKERRALIRDLLIEGVDEARIIEDFGNGILITNPESKHYNKTVKAGTAVVKRDLKAVGTVYRELFGAPLHGDRELGAAISRLRRIALEAESKKNFDAAIRANERIVELSAKLGIKSTEDLNARIKRVLGTERAIPKAIRKPGRKSKWTPWAVDRVIEGARLGQPRGLLAARAAISKSLLKRWVSEARTCRELEDEGKPPPNDIEDPAGKVIFLDRLEIAEAEYVDRCTATINKAVDDGVWQCSFRSLESKHPDDFARRPPQTIKHQHSGPDGESPIPVVVDVAKLAAMSTEQLEALSGYNAGDQNPDKEIDDETVG